MTYKTAATARPREDVVADLKHVRFSGFKACLLWMRPHLFLDWVCESAVGGDAVGNIIRHKTTWGSDSSTRPTGKNSYRYGPSDS